MEKSAQEEREECGICLETLTNPVALPCSHKFCSECLNSWRSKYGDSKTINRKCPLCREKIPPSNEMITQLMYWRNYKRELEAKGDFSSPQYMDIKSYVEELEQKVGDWTETIDYSTGDENCLVLPEDVYDAARTNDIQKVLDWLGSPPVDKQRINAKNPESMNFTLVYSAVHCKNSNLLSILLQLGADVDTVNADGWTPFCSCCFQPDFYSQARILLEWGAEIFNCPKRSKEDIVFLALHKGNSKMANLLNSEFGGRRCEIINMPNRPDLIGKTCVVEEYQPEKDIYEVVFETSKEAVLVGPQNLKRRDRTPSDCGYYITYKNGLVTGRTTRHEFASNEECQAFVASLSNAPAEAELDAQSLLADLNIGLSADSYRLSKKEEKKGRRA